jgi:hypothetical protein
MYILNDVHSPAAFTCHTSWGESMVDYVLCNRMHLQVHQQTQQPKNISDHDLIYTRLPLHAANIKHSSATADRSTQPPNPLRGRTLAHTCSQTEHCIQNGFRVNNSMTTTPAHANGENIHLPHFLLQHSKT